MTEDIERLFRNINQAHIPYQVFEPPTVPSPAIGHAEPETLLAEPERRVVELRPARQQMEPAPQLVQEAAKSGVFRKYVEDDAVGAAAETGGGTPLQPIFDRLREKVRAAQR
jgi:hypothetical protein